MVRRLRGSETNPGCFPRPIVPLLGRRSLNATLARIERDEAAIEPPYPWCRPPQIPCSTDTTKGAALSESQVAAGIPSAPKEVALMFSRTATPVVGFLLLTAVMWATYQLWDVAFARWFG